MRVTEPSYRIPPPDPESSFVHRARLLPGGCIRFAGGSYYHVPDGGNGSDTDDVRMAGSETWCPRRRSARAR